MKHYTLLFELRSALYPKRIKIEIGREKKDGDYQEMMAFSTFSTNQVFLKAHTLDQTMKNKIEAFLDRGEIRDCFAQYCLSISSVLVLIYDKNDMVK